MAFMGKITPSHDRGQNAARISKAVFLNHNDTELAIKGNNRKTQTNFDPQEHKNIK